MAGEAPKGEGGTSDLQLAGTASSEGSLHPRGCTLSLPFWTSVPSRAYPFTGF